MNYPSAKMWVAASLVLVVGSGCFRNAYKVGSGAEASGTPAYSAWQHNLLWGLIGGEEVDLKSICPSGNAYVQNYFSVMDTIIMAALGGFWSPTTVEVYCGDRSRSDVGTAPKRVELSEATVRRVAQDARFMELVEAYAPARAQSLRAALVSTPTEALSCR